MRKTFKSSMLAGKPQVGIRSQLCSAIAAEAIASCGYDYVYLDMEHAPNDLMSVLHQANAIAAAGSHTVVRLPGNDGLLIQRLLDLGIDNLVIPMVESEGDAKSAVAATRYPPQGNRSAAAVHRGNRFGIETDYIATIKDRICLIVQVESRRGLENAAEIAAVDGIDGILFGPADLAADLGHLGSATHPDVVTAITQGIALVRGAGKLAGMSTADAVAAKDWFEKGCCFVSIGGDLQLLTRGAQQLLQPLQVMPGRRGD
jgi:2-keto-3-deoxy-L-rhamnonate aldolase RhmA